MKKTYNKPEIIIDELNEKDVIITSYNTPIGGNELNDIPLDFGDFGKSTGI